MWFANLSLHDRRLYSLITMALIASLVLGLVVGSFLLSGNIQERPDNWVASNPAEPEATLAEYTLISTQPRWFAEGAAKTTAAPKSLAGEPEGFKLLGIVDRAEKRYALFMAQDGELPRKVNQLTLGDNLVGDWNIGEITPSKVIIIAERNGQKPETRELPLYSQAAQPKAAAGKTVKAHKPSAERQPKSATAKERSSNSRSGTTNRADRTNTQKSAADRPKKGSPEAEAARAERAKAAKERAAQRKAERATKPKN